MDAVNAAGAEDAANGDRAVRKVAVTPHWTANPRTTKAAAMHWVPQPRLVRSGLVRRPQRTLSKQTDKRRPTPTPPIQRPVRRVNAASDTAENGAVAMAKARVTASCNATGRPRAKAKPHVAANRNATHVGQPAATTPNRNAMRATPSPRVIVRPATMRRPMQRARAKGAAKAAIARDKADAALKATRANVTANAGNATIAMRDADRQRKITPQAQSRDQPTPRLRQTARPQRFLNISCWRQPNQAYIAPAFARPNIITMTRPNTKQVLSTTRGGATTTICPPPQ